MERQEEIMRKHYEKMVKDTDKRVKSSLFTMQIFHGLDKGGFRDRNGLIHAKYTIYRLTTAIAAYCNQDSDYYHDPEVLETIDHALDYVCRKQHEDGLFDLISCNFHSAPDTAFCIKRLLPYYRCLKKAADTSKEKAILKQMEMIIALWSQRD